MTRQLRNSFASMLAGIVLLAPASSVPGAGTAARFAEVSMIVELNATDEDVGLQFFADAEGWREVEIFDPEGDEIFSAEAEGRLAQQGGGTEFFLESVEPTLDDLPLKEFFDRFPEGTYRFVARLTEGGRARGRVAFTHVLPAGPEVLTPVPGKGEECAEDVAIPVVIAWNEVTSDYFGEPLEVAGYEIIVEGDDVALDVHLPAAAGTVLTIPAELLEAGTEYEFEILAIEEGGNQTITESCFVTAG